MSETRRFKHVAVAGITFQAGSSAIDSSTIMSALVFQLTGNPILVGAVTAILRFGWLFPQLIVGYLAQHGGSSMRYYVIGAFGRALAMGLMALVLALGAGWSAGVLAGLVMVIWTVYAFVSGIVGVPYNDIVARSVAPNLRSRLLATRFFGGGLLALVVVGFADRLVTTLAFPLSYAAIVAMAAGLMLLSSVVFTVMGEPDSAPKKTGAKSQKPTFFQHLKEGVGVFQTDLTFRKFVYAQWCGGAVLMAMPFYVVQAAHSGVDLVDIAWLMGAQTVGALISNVLWGWWGDHLGKVSLLRGIALGRLLPPAIALASGLGLFTGSGEMFYVYLAVFFALGALANGLTIAVIGFLMEISPDDRRPAYSGYFNAITAPAFLLPLLAGLLAALVGLDVVFLLAMIAAALQVYFLHRIDVCAASA
ncbi:MAG: MFS transporter [Alphaproteobacteria bacterium]|nr:MFS transporter [Alphaproteobacteria bacterium]